MKPIEVAYHYFAAWNQRDPLAVVATFAEGGMYRDPTVPQGVSGPALAAYTGGLFAAFPDLSFEVVSIAEVDDHTVVAQWMMRGTNSGPLQGGPPTGGTVALPGADFISVADGKVLSVQGYFDQKTFVEQLGLQAIVQPYSMGPVSFGTATSLQLGKPTKPGAFSLTSLLVKSDEEAQQVINDSQQIIMEMAQMPGFISWIGAAIGHRLYTITAWEDAESPKQLLRGGAHSKAMQTFFSTNFAKAAFTSVWSAHHLNPLWVRCPACGQMASYDDPQGRCQCGQPLPEQPPYW